MTKRRAPSEQDPSTPAQQDEADILEEAGAERDENGELVVSDEAIQELGAVDAASVRINRRLDAMVDKKRANTKNVTFNTGDVLTTYDTILRSWPADTVDIHVKRLTGSPFQDVITSRPRNGTELLAALKAFHGQQEEAQYGIQFKDNSTQQFRGNGRITMRDARPQGQPMQQHPYYPQNGASQPAPQPAPLAVSPQQSPFAYLQEALDTVQRLQGMQPSQPTPQPQPPLQAPAPGASPFAFLQEALDTVQRLQGMNPQPQQPSAQPATQQPQTLDEALRLVEALRRMTQGPQPRGVQPPPMQTQNAFPVPPSRAAPPGMMWEWLPEYDTFALVPKINGGGNQGPMYRGPRPIYGQGDPNERYAPPPPPQRQQSSAERFRESMNEVKSVMQMAEEVSSIGGGRYNEPPQREEQDDDSPVRIVESGSSKLVYDNKDGSLRPWDSVLANLPGMMKWAGEQREAIQKVAAERQRRERQQQQPQHQPQQQLQSTYVAVPVEQEQDLPPPPDEVPPPIDEPPPKTWNIPGTEE